MGVHRFYCGCACGGRDIFRLCNVRHEGVRRAQTAAACAAAVAFPGRVDNFVRFNPINVGMLILQYFFTIVLQIEQEA